MSFLTVRLIPPHRKRCLLRRLIFSGSLLMSVACGADNAAAPKTTAAGTNARIINSLFQANTSDTTPLSIDYLIDSATTKPSALGVPGPGISTGDNANHYATFARGVHSFLARRAGDALNASVYTTEQNQPFLPKQFLPPGIFYTIVVAGVLPATGAIPNGTVPFVLLAEDHFPGPRNPDGVLQPHFKIVNAAPFASSNGKGAVVEIYVTPGATAPDTITKYTPTRYGYYPYASEYMNVNPGSYIITLRASGQIIAQQLVTFAAGEVRTFVLQSTAAGPPSVANHKLTNILDHQY